MSAQWVPSYVGMEGKEQADRQAAKGARVSHGCGMKYPPPPGVQQTIFVLKKYGPNRSVRRTHRSVRATIL